jgi:hypothetical protein
MASVIKAVSFDAVDALALATFWAAVFGSDVDEESTADKAFVEAAGWGGPNLWFTRVSEPTCETAGSSTSHPGLPPLATCP